MYFNIKIFAAHMLAINCCHLGWVFYVRTGSCCAQSVLTKLHVTIMARKWSWRTFMICLEMAQKRVSVSSPQTQNDPENLEQAVSVGQQEVVKDKLDGDEKDQCP